MARREPEPPEARVEIEITAGPEKGARYGVLESVWRRHYPDVQYRVIGSEPIPEQATASEEDAPDA
jgi:hypothetical protein